MPRFRYYDSVLELLQRGLRQYRLVAPGERVGVAVSGGADSVALLRAFAALAPTLGIVPVVLHFNHKLRGADSEADASFVAALSLQLGLDCSLESGDVAALAAQQRLSLEAAGRRARYEFFLRAAAVHRLDCVATAHTRDDQAETVLLRLLRGAGVSGLAGIHRTFPLAALVNAQCAKSPRVIRPLLGISRWQVERYLLDLGQSFCQDASNQSRQFLRNRVRAELLPTLERDYNPRLREALCETAEVAAAENTLIESLVSSTLAQAESDSGLDLKIFAMQPLALQRRILRRLCSPHALALDFAQLEGLRIFAVASCAGTFGLPRGFSAEIVRAKLLPPRLRVIPPNAVASADAAQKI